MLHNIIKEMARFSQSILVLGTILVLILQMNIKKTLAVAPEMGIWPVPIGIEAVFAPGPANQPPAKITIMESLADSPKIAQQKFFPSVSDMTIFLSLRMPAHSQAELRKISSHLLALSHKYGFSPAFILAIITTESAFQPSIISHMGAVGLMQIKPSTAKEVARTLNLKWPGKDALKDPFFNLTVSIEYLAQLRTLFPQQHIYVTAYNFGPFRMKRFLANGVELPLGYYNKIKKYYGIYRYMDKTSVSDLSKL